MDSFEFLSDAVKSVERAEELAPAGSYEHGQYVATALMNAWPKIKAFVEVERRRRPHPRSP